MTTTRTGRSAPDGSLALALRRPDFYPHPVRAVRVIETHLSWVALTGGLAYKIKKPINAGFADFSTLELRRRYCEEELRLNRRLAPEIYLDVVEIRGEPNAPCIGRTGPLIDYAVRMREFPQSALASEAIGRKAFGADEIDVLARTVADFHGRAARAPAGDRLGSPASVLGSALQNFEQIEALRPGAKAAATLRALRLWTEREYEHCSEMLRERQSAGLVRECHGDLHLGNIALIDGKPAPFDCIEFNEELRWIDVISEIAFLAMDLEDRGRPDLAWRMVNRYLEASGDYDSIEVLRFYLVYRALVRAKVHLMRSRQEGVKRAERLRLARAFHGYLRQAQDYTCPPPPTLIVTHGLSGCGKSTLAGPLAERLHALRVRSDLERKRMHGIPTLTSSGSAVGGGIYGMNATNTTYRRIGSIARAALHHNFSVVADATFLHRSEREAFRAIADDAGARFVILDFHVPLDLLRARVTARARQGKDASEAGTEVLERQIATREPLTPAEMRVAVTVDGTLPLARALRATLSSGDGFRRSPTGCA